MLLKSADGGAVGVFPSAASKYGGGLARGRGTNLLEMTKNRSGREGGGGGGHKGTMLDGEGKEGEKNDFCKDGGRGGRGRRFVDALPSGVYS